MKKLTIALVVASIVVGVLIGRHLLEHMIVWHGPPTPAPAPEPPPPPPTYTVSPTMKLPQLTFAGMNFLTVPPGSFIMGSPAGEPGAADSTVPETQQFRTINKSFALSQYETTRSAYECVMGPIDPKHQLSEADKFLPMSEVTWDKAVEFCVKLSEQNPGKRFRLPTEIEWEYACRAGDHPEMFAVWRGGGAALSDALAALGRKDRHKLKIGAEASFAFTGNSGAPRPVGSFAPNAWGFYDMHGNVAEWCSYSADTPPEFRPPKLTFRPIRGGSYSSSAMACRCAQRAWERQSRKTDAIGFRVLLENP